MPSAKQKFLFVSFESRRVEGGVDGGVDGDGLGGELGAGEYFYWKYHLPKFFYRNNCDRNIAIELEG
jgi:hypothetical protein